MAASFTTSKTRAAASHGQESQSSQTSARPALAIATNSGSWNSQYLTKTGIAAAYPRSAPA
jgi:hypothetical protein